MSKRVYISLLAILTALLCAYAIYYVVQHTVGLPCDSTGSMFGYATCECDGYKTEPVWDGIPGSPATTKCVGTIISKKKYQCFALERRCEEI